MHLLTIIPIFVGVTLDGTGFDEVQTTHDLDLDYTYLFRSKWLYLDLDLPTADYFKLASTPNHRLVVINIISILLDLLIKETRFKETLLGFRPSIVSWR